jgi:hypothetical protein
MRFFFLFRPMRFTPEFPFLTSKRGLRCTLQLALHHRRRPPRCGNGPGIRAHARLASGWLTHLCREGVEPSGLQRKVSGSLHPFPLSKACPDASWAHALRWAMDSPAGQPAYWASRLGLVRRFAEYRSSADPRTEVPPLGLLPHSY